MPIPVILESCHSGKKAWHWLGTFPLLPLEFEEFSKALTDTEAEMNLIKCAPEITGWDADHIVDWIETLSRGI